MKLGAIRQREWITAILSSTKSSARGRIRRSWGELMEEFLEGSGKFPAVYGPAVVGLLFIILEFRGQPAYERSRGSKD